MNLSLPGFGGPPAPRRNTIFAGDAVEVLRSWPAGCVDLVVTDPAYESLEKHRAKGTTTRLTDWFAVFPNRRFPELLAELYRVLAADAHCYVMCDEETADVLKPLAGAAGFQVWKTLVWVKTKANTPAAGWPAGEPAEVASATTAVGMGYHWRATTERVLFLEKGRRPLVHRGWPDVLFAPRVRGGYPTEKPPALVERLIRNSSARGDVVLDPFCGSGVVGDVARQLGRDYLLVDLNVGPARARLAGRGNPAGRRT